MILLFWNRLANCQFGLLEANEIFCGPRPQSSSRILTPLRSPSWVCLAKASILAFISESSQGVAGSQGVFPQVQDGGCRCLEGCPHLLHSHKETQKYTMVELGILWQVSLQVLVKNIPLIAPDPCNPCKRFGDGTFQIPRDTRTCRGYRSCPLL